jgi:CRISPR/Cas system-associated exonuclease Cas4 (RecB family)
MPVQIASEEDTVGPYNRLSASQVNSYNNCSRLWFYEKIRRFRMPQIPVLFVGRAVEDAVCKMLRESPGLMVASADSKILAKTPLDENGLPTRDGGDWPATNLLVLPSSMHPSSIEELKEWGKRRLDIHLPLSLEAMKKEWLSDERKAGDWSSVDVQYCLKMCYSALDMHLAELQRCVDANGGPNLESWREGIREVWPAPDGRDFKLDRSHPLASKDSFTLVEAWEVCRPWFVDPGAEKFTMNAIHPQHWFQGEYDLVYRWDGKIKIVDLKASVGKGDRSGNYVDQLRIYAMLWWVTHEKNETVESLEIWYLGADVVKDVEVPSVEELQKMETELEQMWKLLKENKPDIEQCPPNPAPMRGFSAGGKSIDAPNESRCDSCDWEQICPGGSGNDDLPSAGIVNLPGSSSSFDITEIAQLNPRATIVAEVFSVVGANSKPVPQITICQGTNFAKIQIISETHESGQRSWPLGIKKGDLVKLDGLVFTVNWKGEIVLKVDPHAIIIPASPSEECTTDLLSYRAKYHVAGRVIYRFEKRGIGRTGKEWHRKGLMIQDSTGAMKVGGWANDWPPQYDTVHVGDTVVVANIGIDAWATEVRGEISRNSTFQTIERISRN